MKHLGPDSSVTNLCGLYPSHCFKYHLNLCIMVCANTFSFRPCVHVQLTRAFSCSSQNTTKEAHKSSLSDALTLTFGTKVHKIFGNDDCFRHRKWYMISALYIIKTMRLNCKIRIREPLLLSMDNWKQLSGIN